MHLGWQADHSVDDDRADRACGRHVWRMRDLAHALPGVYITEVCGQCGALRINELDDLLRDLCDA